MTEHAIRLKEYSDKVEDSTDIAIEVVRSQAAWLLYVPESELTAGEHERVLAACQRFYLSIRPLTEKYID